MQYLGREGNKKHETETGSKKLVLVLRTRLAQATHLVFSCQSSLQYVQKYFDKNNVKAYFFNERLSGNEVSIYGETIKLHDSLYLDLLTVWGNGSGLRYK